MLDSPAIPDSELTRDSAVWIDTNLPPATASHAWDTLGLDTQDLGIPITTLHDLPYTIRLQILLGMDLHSTPSLTLFRM